MYKNKCKKGSFAFNLSIAYYKNETFDKCKKQYLNIIQRTSPLHYNLFIRIYWQNRCCSERV